MKEEIKEGLGYEGDPRMIDTHRPVPKADGGTYVDGNVVLKSPVEHMEEHGNLRLREDSLDEIKTLVDDREQFMKLFYKVNNQLLAYQRGTDNPSELTVGRLEEEVEKVGEWLKGSEKLIEVWVKEHRKEDVIIDMAMNVHGLGKMTIAYLMVYVDLEKARHASSLWSYAGLHCSSGDRYTKGVAGGGNKTLRTALWRTADSMMKTRGAYREVYDRTKARLSVSEKIVKSRNTQGKLVEVPWKDTKPGHRHGAALRAMMKHLLADYWFVGREARDLDTTPLYVEERLGHQGIIRPTERGWVVSE